MTDDESADLKLLELANSKGKFAIQIGYVFPDAAVRFAFERGIDQEWFTLVDVDMLAGRTPATIHLPGGTVASPLMKIFRLTAAGEERRDELRATGDR